MNIQRQETYKATSAVNFNTVFKKEEINPENQFELIHMALNALKDATKKKPTHRQVEKILQQVLWPETRNLVKTAEAICNDHIKKILKSYLNTDDSAFEVDPKRMNIGDCLSTLLQLAEL
jgi:hypothetical protein